MLVIELIGYAAALLTTAALLPEVYRVWKTREAKSISFYWLGLLGLGQVLWLVYGIYISAFPVAAAAAATMAIIAMLTAIVIMDDKVSFRAIAK